MNSQTDDFSPGTMRLAHELFEALRRRTRARFEECGYAGIGLTHVRVLQFIVYAGGSLSEIARQTWISRQRVAKTAAELQEAGYIKLAASHEDRRASEAVLTPAGKKMFRALRSVIDRTEQDLASAIGKRKLADLRQGLQQLTDWVRAEEGERNS